MNLEWLGDYLNDHLAGSVLVIEMIEHCRDNNAAGGTQQGLETLRVEIVEDQTVLKDILKRTKTEQQLIKKTAAWLAEKAGRLKVGGTSEDPRRVAFHRLQQLELLYVGVTGKLELWRLLEEIASVDLQFADLNLSKLKQRAESQLERIEELRLEAARESFLG